MSRSFAAPAGAREGVAGVVPHAGWEYSGSVALEVMSCLARRIDTIVIIGGHLGPSDGIICSPEEAWETPLGTVPADMELLSALRAAVQVGEDRHADNSVEIHLPMVAALFPGTRVLGLRAAPRASAADLGAGIARGAAELGRAVAVLGSTDLTHYGASYGFAPAGRGPAALDWVRGTNDRRLVDCLVALDLDGTLAHALRDRAACSAGGALAAMAFARARGCTEGRLLRYATSHDVSPAESFVGYAGVLYS
jgi:AmmeMemoRadiSam system protein B